MRRAATSVLPCLIIMAVLAAVLPSAGSAADGPAPPSRLRCEYLTNPLGIDVRQPRLAWVVEHSGRGQMQTAYQVLVATSPGLLDQDRGDIWDSGKVLSEDSIQVTYSGKPLESGRTYFWKVRTWDTADKAGPYSRAAHFEMGLLSRSEWKGKWISGDGLLRKEVGLDEKVVRARAYVTALGYYELRINGEKVGDNVRDPAWTTYTMRVLYTTYDVTGYLRQGANALGVMLGGGWATLRTDAVVPVYYKAPALMLQIDVELESGKKVAVTSDGSWTTRRGPIVSDSIFDGEVYDARLELPGWDRPGFDASSWSAAKSAEGSQGVLSAQMMPPIRVVDTLVPVSISNPRPGVYVYDMGQNFSGWVRLRVRGPAGATVEMRFSELLQPSGMINRENLLWAKARDRYTLHGEGVEVYEPRFTYHGFRYVEVTGYPGTPGLDSLRGRVVCTAVEPAGEFTTSNPLLNQIQRLIRWSQSSNLQGIPTDCDQRPERMGWLADAHLTAEEAMLNFDMAAFYTNFIRNIHDVQDPDGTITDTVPFKYGGRPADPAWGAAYPLLCWYMYEQYGDRRILDENFDGLKKYVEFLRHRAPDNVLRDSSTGDWVATGPTPGELVSAAYYYWDVDILAKTASVLGRSADARAYAQLAGRIKDAFNRTFFNPTAMIYANGSQTAQVLPLYLDLVPKEKAGDVLFNLYKDIIYFHDTHISCGIIGTKYLFPLLTRLGISDLAYDLATQTTYPSWGYMISHGATTMWELWQEKAGPSMNSQNHPALGSVGAWFYQALGGINLGSDGAGYRRILIRPQVVRDLTSASATVETVRGKVSCTWTRSCGAITVDVTVPANSEARVIIPKDREMTGTVVREGGRVVWENGRFVAGVEGVKNAVSEVRHVAVLVYVPEGIVIDVGSGRYSFTLTAE